MRPGRAVSARAGYTLIEVVVAVAILAVAVALSAPLLLRAIESQKEGAALRAVDEGAMRARTRAYLEGDSITLSPERIPAGLFDLPDDWRVEAEEEIVFLPTGYCGGGRLTLTDRFGQPEDVVLEPVTCRVRRAR